MLATIDMVLFALLLTAFIVTSIRHGVSALIHQQAMMTINWIVTMVTMMFSGKLIPTIMAVVSLLLQIFMFWAFPRTSFTAISVQLVAFIYWFVSIKMEANN